MTIPWKALWLPKAASLRLNQSSVTSLWRIWPTTRWAVCPTLWRGAMSKSLRNLYPATSPLRTWPPTKSPTEASWGSLPRAQNLQPGALCKIYLSQTPPSSKISSKLGQHPRYLPKLPLPMPLLRRRWIFWRLCRPITGTLRVARLTLAGLCLPLRRTAALKAPPPPPRMTTSSRQLRSQSQSNPCPIWPCLSSLWTARLPLRSAMCSTHLSLLKTTSLPGLAYRETSLWRVKLPTPLALLPRRWAGARHRTLSSPATSLRRWMLWGTGYIGPSLRQALGRAAVFL